MAILKILIVDDEEYVLEMIRLMLEDRGFEVTTARNGEEGIEKTKALKPNLVLMDVMMEPMSGLEATQKLKSDVATSAIPILILTGKSMNKDKEEALSAGADGFVTKPVLPSRLLEEINKCLG